MIMITKLTGMELVLHEWKQDSFTIVFNVDEHFKEVLRENFTSIEEALKRYSEVLVFLYKHPHRWFELKGGK